jgi:hypothetical protein
MSATAEQMGRELASRIVHEAVDEVRGRSSRKWGVAFLALLLGGAIALVVVQLRARQVATESDEGQVYSPLSPSTS